MLKMLHKILDKPGLAAVLLRLGLAIILLYAAIGSMVSPRDWIGYMPAFVDEIFDSSIMLKVFSVIELLLAAWLLSGSYIRYAALATAALLGGIVVFNFDLFMITFRDLALVFAALALAALSKPES